MYKLLISLFALSIIGGANAQNVGIGTTTPLYKLHIKSGSDSLMLLENAHPLSFGATNNVYFKTGVGTSPYTGAIKTIGQSATEARLGFFTNASALPDGLQERISILNDGNVGIRTSTPAFPFQVESPYYGIVHSYDGTQMGTYIDPEGGWLGTISNNPLHFFTNNSGQIMTITQLANVGIGTAAPVTKLNIVGSGSNPSIPGLTSSGVFRVGIGDRDGIDFGKMGDAPNAGWIQAGFDGTDGHPLSLQPLGGNVGIGIIAPVTKLNIVGATSNPSIPGVTSTGVFRVGVGDRDGIDFGKMGVDPYTGWIQSGFDGTYGDPLSLQPSGGNVGIGTINPSARLQIGDFSNSNDTYLNINTSGGNQYSAGLGLYHHDNTVGWLLESDERNSSFAIKHRNGSSFNIPVFMIDFGENVGIGTSSPTHKLTVNGSSNFSDNMGIGQVPFSNTRLRINSSTNFYGLYVEGASATGAGLLAEGRTVFNVLQKQVVIDGPASGNATNFDNSYPLLIQGSKQGIGIHINAATAHAGNNYLYFRDNSFIRGSVAGQSLSELQSSADYIWFNSMATLEESFILAEGIACGVQIDLGEAGVMAVEGALIYAKWAQAFLNMQNSVGVVYQSNAADYAEWLERADSKDDLEPGMIVGVTGGRISKRTDGAMRLMVISTAPLVLGNTPPEGRQSAFEKVAFMGQVPVRVRGKVEVGDYILASGQDDGLGIAVLSSKMRLNDYDRVVGVAWSSSISQNGESLINTAVGLNTNDLIGEIKQQKTEVEQLKETLAGIMAYLKEKDPAFKLSTPYASKSETTKPLITTPVIPASLPVKKSFSTTNFTELNELLRSNPELVDNMLSKAKEICAASGMDVNSDHAQELFDRNAFFQRLEKAAKFKIEPRKTMQPAKENPMPVLPKAD